MYKLVIPKNSESPDEMPHNATFHQDLQYSLREKRISEIFLIKIAFLAQKEMQFLLEKSKLRPLCIGN